MAPCKTIKMNSTDQKKAHRKRARALAIPVLVLVMFGTYIPITSAGEANGTCTEIHLAYRGARECIVIKHWPFLSQTSGQEKKHFGFHEVKNYTDKKASFYHQYSQFADEVTAMKQINLDRTKLALARLAASNVSLQAISQVFDCLTRAFLSQYQGVNDEVLRRNFTQAYYLCKSVLVFDLDRHLSQQINEPLDFFPVYNITAANYSTATNVKSYTDPYMNFFINDANRLVEQNSTTIAAADVESIDNNGLIHFSSGDVIPAPGTEQISTQVMQEIEAEILQVLN